MIILNGENGGGQMLRTALAMSTITMKPFKMINIRKNRPNPGLKAQHLSCIKAYEKLFNCKIINNIISETEIEFYPGKLKSKKLDIDIGTAGSITLLLQSLLLPCFLEGTNFKIKVKGGTDVKWSMSLDYFVEVILPQFKRFAEFQFSLNRRGFYPKGNGEIELKILKSTQNIIKNINLVNEAKLECIRGVSVASKELNVKNVSERQSLFVKNYFSKFKTTISIESRYNETDSRGNVVSLWAIYSNPKIIDYYNIMKTGSDALGEKNKSSEEVAKEASEKLYNIIKDGFCCDEHLADNLIPLLALIKGQIKIKNITNHITNNIYVCEQFINTKFEIKDNIIYAI
jgi:RNA 3'-terminal phosphate cyclase (GTP)